MKLLGFCDFVNGIEGTVVAAAVVIMCDAVRGGDMVVTLARECLGICGMLQVYEDDDVGNDVAKDTDIFGVGADADAAATEVTEMLRAADDDIEKLFGPANVADERDDDGMACSLCLCCFAADAAVVVDGVVVVLLYDV